MIEIRENAIAIVNKGLGYNGNEVEELEISNWGGKYVTTMSIRTKNGRETMEFHVDEFIALAEILKQLKMHRK